MASVSVGLWLAVGGRHESAAENGVSHFIEHMLFKGTRRRSARQISEAVEGIGGYLNAFTSEEHTCYYARAPKGEFALLMDVLGDMLVNSRFSRAEIEKERAVIREEIAMYLDQPAQHVQELLNAALWPDHPLGRPLTGTLARLEQLDRKTLTRYHRRHYTAGNLIVSVAGNLGEARARREAARLAEALGPGPRAAWTPVGPGHGAPALRLHTRDTEQTQFALGIRTCSRRDPRRFELRLLNTLLGENMSSRLFVSLREERGLAYSVGSSVSFFADAGDLVVSVGLETGNVRAALRLVMEELRRLRERPPGRRELERARDYLIGQLELGLEGTESRMNWLAEQMLEQGRLVSAARLKSRLRSIQPRDIQAVARAFFRPENLALALVSPLKRAGHLRRLLTFDG